MREFDKPIGRVWRRLRVQRFLSAFVWCWCGALIAAAVGIGASRLLGRPLPGPLWWPFAGATGLGAMIAGLIAATSGASKLDAAIAIDRAFLLNERLSTTLSLPDELRRTPAGRAQAADTLRHVEALDLASKFGVRTPRRAWVPLIPAALGAGLLAMPAGWVQRNARADRVENQVDPKLVTQKTQAIRQTLARKRKEMDPAKFAETEKLFAEIEKAADQLSKAPPADKDKALLKLNEMTDALKDRQKQLGTAEQVTKQLQQLKQNGPEGPADPFAKALSKGDFPKAAAELKDLQEKLASGKMSEKEKQALKDQIGEMKKQLEKLANLENRKKQLEEARKNGAMTQEQFDKQMAKLNEQAKDLKKLQQLAQKLGEAHKALDQGDMRKAADALGMTQKDVEQMAKQAQEMETLSEAMADIQDAKSAMAGEDGANQLGKNFGEMDGGTGQSPDGPPGSNLGRGRGQGARPEAKDSTASYNTKVKTQIGKGSAVKVGDGPPSAQTKGDSTINEQETVEAASGQSAEALTNQKVPSGVKKHISGYFDELRKGN